MRRAFLSAAPRSLRALPVVLAFSLGNVPASAGPQDRAEAAQARGDLRAAQIEWRNAVRDQPDSAASRAALAAVSLDIGDTELAEREARAALERGFDKSAGTAMLMRAYVLAGRFEDLLRDFPLPDSPPSLAAQIAAARTQAQLALRQVDEARQSATRAMQLAPGLAEANLAMAAVALAAGDRAAAEAAIDAVLAKDPDNTEALLRKGSLQYERRELRPAVATFTRLLNRSPGNVSARLRRAETFLRLGEDAPARTDVEAALRNLPASAPGIYMLGLLQARARDWAGADATLQKLGPAIGGFSDGFLVLATVKRGLGQVAQAEDAARRYVARQPEDARGARLLASMELESNRPEDAAATLSALAARGQADAETLDMLGRVQMSLNRYRDAAETFQAAAAKAPENAGILSRLAAARLALGDTAGTADAASRAMQSGATNAAPQQMLAFAALFRGDGAAAQAEYDRMPSEARQSEAGRVLDGSLKLSRMELPAARTAFAAALKAFPNSTSARMGLARVANLQGQPEEAETLLTEILRQDPNHAEATAQLTAAAMPGAPRAQQALAALAAAQASAPAEPLLALSLANVYLRHSEPQRAVAVLETSQLRGQQDVRLPLARAEAHAAASQWAEAETASREALALAPASTSARRQLAGLMVRAGDARAAEALIQEGLRAKPDDAALQQALVAILLKSQGLPAAQAAAERLAQQASARPASLQLPGDLLVSAGKPEDGARAYAEAARTAPSSVLALREAAAWREVGKRDEALRALKTWLARAPDDADVLLLWSQLHIEANQLAEAERALKIVVERRPQDAVALNNLAWVIGQRGGPDAEDLAERAFFLAPNPDTADTLGWILARTGQAERAVPLLRRAASARSSDPAMMFRLAYALQATGAKDEAMALLAPALASTAAFPERAEATRLLAQLRGQH